MSKNILKLVSILAIFAIMLTSCQFFPGNNTTNPTNPSTSNSTTTSSTIEGGGGENPPKQDNSATPTIYLAGDSTVKTYEDGQYIAGWGQYLSLFLDGEITVANAANGGRSSRSFINEGRLYNIDNPEFNYSFSQNGGKSIEDCIKAGDFLLIQFGHNDDASKLSNYQTIYDRMVPLGEPDANGIYPTTPAQKMPTTSLPEEYTKAASDAEEANALAEAKKYGSEYYAYHSGGTYKWYLKQYIDFARSVGAIPVLVTPVARVKFSGGSIIGGAGLHGANFAYVEAVRQLAKEENCLLIDLFAHSKIMLEAATSTYANYLMALKPNDLTGEWPTGYDSAYGNADAGYTGIEATHYNKYGSFVLAAFVAESILANEDEVANGERFNFKDHILSTPSEFIDPSNLMSKSKVSAIETLLKEINITNPNRTYPNPQEAIDAINYIETTFGEVTLENHLEVLKYCEIAREKYNRINVDDRALVTNLEKLEAYEKAVKEQIEAARPEPVRVVVFDADLLELESYTSTVTEQGFTLVATDAKKMDRKSAKFTFQYAGKSYNTTYGLSVGGKATFGSNRYVSFTLDGPCKVTVVAKSSGSDARTVLMVDSAGKNVGSFEAGTSISVTSLDITEAGTYSIGSAGSGMYIFRIIIEYFE